MAHMGSGEGELTKKEGFEKSTNIATMADDKSVPVYRRSRMVEGGEEGRNLSPLYIHIDVDEQW